MDYKESIEFLFSQLPMFSRMGAAAYKPGLDTSLQLDKYFNHPHRSFKSIHVGGTNGKGSTSHMLAAILAAQGYKTGLYTSPHLADFGERIRINGEMISEQGVIDFIENFRNSDYNGHPSFFELTMMMAFDWFRKNNVDYAVIEVGMGGRLDSTNIIDPVACVITNISWDHTQFLGSTLEAIAAEKAGIIKPGKPVVIGESNGAVRKVFADKASEMGSDITFADDCRPLAHIEPGVDGFGWKCRSIDGIEFESPLSGDYQKCNINTTLSAIKMLRKTGLELSDESVIKGFRDVCKTTGFMGRWTILSKSPLTICDTGHNQAGLEYNMAQLDRLMELHKGATLHIVCGFVADKDIDHIIGMFPKSATYYITNAQIPRALPANKLVERFSAIGIEAPTFDCVDKAYNAAIKKAAKNDIIYVGGSTFIVADLLASLNK